MLTFVFLGIAVSVAVTAGTAFVAFVRVAFGERPAGGDPANLA
jgi:hypothetical protein